MGSRTARGAVVALRPMIGEAATQVVIGRVDLLELALRPVAQARIMFKAIWVPYASQVAVGPLHIFYRRICWQLEGREPSIDVWSAHRQ